MDVSETNHRIAVIVGYTGLIGTAVLKLIQKNTGYREVHLLGRNKPEIEPDPRVIFHKVDLLHLTLNKQSYQHADVFCCLGTTMKKAGSKEKFKEVDFEMIVEVAKTFETKENKFILISSIGANPESSNFYLRTKGETEKNILSLNYDSIIILRPSILFGPRKETRIGEKIGIYSMKMLSPFMIGSLRKYRGNESTDVAQVMLAAAQSKHDGKYIIESYDITRLANGKQIGQSPIVPNI